MPHLDTIAAYAPRFFAATAGMGYTRRGIFWSELLAFAALADKSGATHIVESGTGLGHSARVLARLFPVVTTIDITPYAGEPLPANVFVKTADATDVLFHPIDNVSTWACLIDGPKHKAAAKLAYVLSHRPAPRPCVIGIHDLHVGSPGREYTAMLFPEMFFTDDAAYVAAYGHMDKECLATAASRKKTFPTHGPTMGLVVL